MSALATPSIKRSVRFYEATLGKKVVMAITGVVLFGYVIGHLAGNLQIFSGNPENINNYAIFLHTHTAALWAVRALLLVAVLLHMWSAFQLWLRKRSARPVGYVKKDDVPTAYAARTMYWSGPIIAAFVIFHILHLTTGDVFPLQHLADNPEHYDVYANVILGFQHPAVSAAYIFAICLLCLHLYHGIWSMFQSVGLSHPRYTPGLKRFSAIFAILVAAGYISIPVAVLTGLLHL
jgi:succinate dehydrogenase / fumarate reductase cytochrome b subunit